MKTITRIKDGIGRDARWVVGRVALNNPKKFMQHYEFALWHKQVECQPQIAELRFMARGDGGHPTFYATFNGKVTSSNFQSCFGGVPIGKGGIDEEVGKDATYTQSWEAEWNLGHILSRTDYTYTFDLDLDALDIQWEVLNLGGYAPGDILYREAEPWRNLPSTGLRATITPHDPQYIEGKRSEAEYALRDYPAERPEYAAYWKRRRNAMDRLLMRIAQFTSKEEVSQ